MNAGHVTEEERSWAQKILYEGVDSNAQLLSYCRFLVSPGEGCTPVRNERGGIVGYARQETAEAIEGLASSEAVHAGLAASSSEPEMRGAHQAVAQNYRLARMVRETDAAYAAQTFELSATGWWELAPEDLKSAYTGVSAHQRAEKDALEADACRDRLLGLGRKALAARLRKEEVIKTAKTATGEELETWIKEASSSADDVAFLVLIRERDARSKRIRAARKRSQKAPASDTPFTEDEEKLVSNTAAQTEKMDERKLSELRDVPVVTRGDQLRHEAVTRELSRRN